MEQVIANKLREWADTYNNPAFIKDDPVSFPHRFEKKEDIEVSGFLTSWIAYGNRKQILKKAELWHSEMDGKPLAYILDKRYARYKDDTRPFYRFFKMRDVFDLCERMNTIYTKHGSLEAAAISIGGDPVAALQMLFEKVNGIPQSKQSACKRLSMFVRWMVRNDGIVDFGIWENFNQKDLLIPLDTHVFTMAKRLGMTARNTADRKAAEEITAALREIWPDDPCRGDFALFGYGINETPHPRHNQTLKQQME